MTSHPLPRSVLFAADADSGRYRGILDHLTGAPSQFAVRKIDSDAALLDAAAMGASSICLIGEMADGRTRIDLLRRLRSTGYSQPVIMLVAGNDDEAGSGILEAGADDYLAEEEFDPRLIDRSIRYALRSAHLRARAEFEASRSHSIIENIPATIWEIWFHPDPSLRRVGSINSRLEATLGYSREEWLGSPDFWLTAVHPEDRERAREVAAAGLAGNGDHILCCRMISRDGRIFWMQAHVTIIHDEAGAPVGVRGIATDVTDLKNAERALREANEGLELRVAERTVELQAAFSRVRQAYAEQKQFVANASHDLRTPVTIVRAELELLLWRTKDDQVTRDSLENALTGLARLDWLAADLLLLSDVESETGAITFARAGIAGIVREAMSTVAANALQKGVVWLIDIDRTAEIYCDVDLIQRAVANLLDNAIRYSEREGVVTVTTRIGESDIAIAIADEGPGIAAADLPRIWDSFYRSSVARSGYGSGLGLTIARSIIEAHNGRLTVDSGIGVGTTFTVSIPLSPSAGYGTTICLCRG